MTEFSCPACGEDQVTIMTSKKIMEEPFGGRKEIDIHNHRCETCGFEGDFLNRNDEIINHCSDTLKKQAVENILNYFMKNNNSFSSIERALELPQRTLSKWKTKDSPPSAAGVSLLKLIRLFPWLIDVADCKFDYENAQKIYITHAMTTVIGKMHFTDVGLRTPEMTSSSGVLSINMPDYGQDTNESGSTFESIPSYTVQAF